MSRTATSTEPAVARLRVERRGGRSIVATLLDAAPLGLRLLDDDGDVARVAVVQTAAMLVAGDDVVLAVEVDDGAALELTEISATLAHPVAAGATPIRQRLEARVGDGARLVLIEQPLVLAADTRAARTTAIDLRGAARCLLRETLVLGRDGEAPGAAIVRVRVTRDGAPVADDALDTAEPDVLASPAVLGGARALATLGLYGATPPGPLPPRALSLGPVDTLARALTADGPPDAALARTTAAWRAVTLAPAQSVSRSGSSNNARTRARKVAASAP